MQDHVLLFKAIHALKIDVPVLDYCIVDNRIQLHLYGGQVKTWQIPVESPQLKAAPPAQPKSTAAASRSPHAKPKPKAKSVKK